LARWFSPVHPRNFSTTAGLKKPILVADNAII
jgi:hypothetical protein